MGIKTCIKSKIMNRVMKKRRKNEVYDEIESELYVTPDSAGADANNSYYFSAHDMDGTALFFRYAQRGGGENAKAELWVAYRAADGTAFVNESTLFNLADCPAGVECITPLKEWRFFFKGKMLPVSPGGGLVAAPCGEAVDAVLDAVFTSDKSLYHFSRDTDVAVYCRAIAAEKWKRGFADEIKKNNQVHIEQEGHIKGKLSIKAVYEMSMAGGTDIEYIFDLVGIRDHSYGRRVWSYMNRHMWHFALLEDGQFRNTNSVRYPALNVKGIRTGYKMNKGKITNVTDTILEKDFSVHSLPLEGTYTVKYADKTVEQCTFKTDIIFPFEFSDEGGGYLMYEGVAAYTFNGAKGRGITEFGYNKDKTRYR